jgi:large subunit ribosomal protein L17e
VREVGHAIKGMDLLKAITYLEDVLNYKQAVPFLRYGGGMGRHAQGKLRNVAGDKCAWPQKASKHFIGLLKNAQANAEYKGIQPEDLVVSHVQVNQAPCMRRRTYRAHGRINAYMSCPAHVEIVCAAKKPVVAKPTAEAALPTRKAMAQKRLHLRVGGGL